MKKIHINLFFILLAFTSLCKAQYNVMLDFNGTDGQNPYAALTASGNKLYGITQAGFGQIFSMDTNGSVNRDLFDFNITDGYGPATASLITSKGVIYGTMVGGGTGDSGVVFSIDTNGSNFKDIVNFNGPNGSAPQNTLTYGNGILYGTTIQGGAYHLGNIFSLDTNGNNFKDIFDFSALNGGTPYCTLTLLGSKLFGTMNSGGLNDSGYIFSIDTNGSNYKDLFDFSGPNGSGPGGAFVYSSGKFYGQAGGGVFHYGVLFSIDTNGSNYKKLHDFSSVDEYPSNSLTLVRNKLYGIAPYGGPSQFGVIFSLDTNGTGYNDLFSFNGTDGANPVDALTLAGNKLYGLTNAGGTFSGYGVIFSFDTAKSLASINDLDKISGTIDAFPNPSSGLFTVTHSPPELASGTQSVEVYNTLGEKVYSQFTTINSQLTIDLSSQPNGIYLYRILAASGNLIGEGKLVIQK